MKSVFALAISLHLFAAFTAAAAPSEKPSQELLRTTTQVEPLAAKLSKNIYRNEDYQANYSVSVPYEAEETYYESVPYQDTEDYWEQCPYQTQEQVCRNNVSYRQECSSQQVCSGGSGGVNGAKECGINPSACSSAPTCHSEQVCQNVPVNNQECHSESVTRYRQERRTRTVTKYRQETRYRTVTRYRDEERCCVTKTRSVYDHQTSADVTLIFPVEATLEASEKESFKIALGSDSALKVSSIKSIYTYVPLVSNQGSGKYEVQMKLEPTYRADQLGQDKISGLKLVVVGNKLRLSFNDSGAVRKTRTHYDLQLIDAGGAALIQDARDNGNATQRISWDINATSVAGKTVAIRMGVTRDGIVIAAPVAFELQANLVVKKEASYDASPYTRASNINHFQIAGKNETIVLSFRDTTKVIDEVATEYRLGVFTQEGKTGRLLAEKTFKREDLKADKHANMLLSLSGDFGISAEELAQLNPKKIIALSGEVYRYGSRFKGSKAVVAVKTKLTIPKK